MNHICWNGLNAMQNACALNDMTTLEYLLSQGASVLNYNFEYSATFYNPLQLAVANGNSHMLALLLQNANTSSDRFRYTRFRSLYNTIMSRLQYDETEHTIISLLRVQMRYDKSWHINSRRYGHSKLYICAKNKAKNKEAQKKVLRFLLSEGANPKLERHLKQTLPRDIQEFFTE